MPHTIKAWQCDYCGRYRINKASITRHEEICFSNPDRKILEGQLAVFATIPRELLITDSYGVPNSDWEEPYWDAPPDLLKNINGGRLKMMELWDLDMCIKMVSGRK